MITQLACPFTNSNSGTLETPNTACTDEVGSQGSNEPWAMLRHRLCESVQKRCQKLYNDVERRARKTPSRVSLSEFTLICVWDVAHLILLQTGRGQRDRFLRAPGDVGQVC